MLQEIPKMYISLMPVLLAGVFNMVWVKLGPKTWRKPLDQGKICRDGRRLFGENKTYLGLIGYIGLASILSWGWGRIAQTIPALQAQNYFYAYHTNEDAYNLLIGAFLGLAYALFELPNSFLKRRLNIDPGSAAQTKNSFIFVLLDQADSLFGVALVLWFFYPLGIGRYLMIVLIGAATHMLLNFLLYLAHLRKSPL